MSNLNIKQSPIYGNCRVLAPDGDLLFLCLPKKANWYLSRKLANVISEDPMTIQLTFKPNGKGQTGDSYALSEKQNKCVVCGTEIDLTRHHIVPYTYRKHFPEDIKSHNSHDVVPICFQHHKEYEENYAIQLKRELAKKYKAPLETETKVRTDLSLVVKYSKLLMDKPCDLPYSRKKQIIKTIRDYHGIVGKLRQVILTYAYVDLSKSKTENHGKTVVNKQIKNKSLQSFVEMWRKHFIKSTNPLFMPKYWSLKRKITKN
jgi:hypothetical protein